MILQQVRQYMRIDQTRNYLRITSCHVRKSKLRHRNHLDYIGSEDVFSLIQIGVFKFRT